MGACLRRERTSRGDPTHATALAPTVFNNVPQRSRSSQPQSMPSALPVPSLAVSRFLAPGADDTDNVLRKPFEDVLSRFTIGKELGRGRFHVTHACRERATGLRYACKSISKRKLVDKSDREYMRREINIMQHLSGQANIVEFKGAYEDANSVHLVMELCVGGDLFDRIFAQGFYSERAAAGIFRDIIKTVDVCHFMGVMHRDLKPENFLLTTEDEGAMLKVTGFGLSTFIQEGKVYTDAVGSSHYIAPEVLRGCYAQESDIWSAGVILYILLSGSPPFRASNEIGILDAVLRGCVDFQTAPWPTISDSAKDLIRKMLTMDPKQRITAAQVLEHPWIRGGGGSGTALDEPLDSEVLARLKQFRALNTLKKLALKVIAEHLSEEEIEGLKQRFMETDTSNRGTIPYEYLFDLVQVRSKLSMAEAVQLMDPIRHAAKVAGADGDVDYVELITAALHRHRLERDEPLYRPFEHFDKGDSGSELQRAREEIMFQLS